MEAYETMTLNAVRKRDRAHYERETVHAILDAGLVAHVGFVDRDKPVVIPMIYTRRGETIYLHGAKATRFIKTLSGGVPACVTVTHVDGIVIARSAFHCSMNYRSVVVHGTARLVDGDEKEAAMVAITDHIAPGRWDESRPMTDKEFRSTGVIAVAIEQAAAKVRPGGVADEEEDYALPIWAGVIPMRTVFDPPVEDDRLHPDVTVPPSVGKVLERNND